MTSKVNEQEAFDYSKKINVIDGLRGIAILMVFYHHVLRTPVFLMLDKFRLFIGLGSWPCVLAFGGWTGVNLFFILSGFVLYRPYQLQYKVLNSRGDMFNFYLKRFKRLYPLLTINLLISFFFIFKPSIKTFKSLILTLTTISIFTYSEFAPMLNKTLWSLSVEIWFSLLFPFLIFGVYKFGFKNVTISIFLLSLFVRLIGMLIYPGQHGVVPFKDGFLGRLDDFFLGMVICKFYYEKKYCFKDKFAYSFIHSFIHSFWYFAMSILFIFGSWLIWDLATINKIPVYAEAFIYWLFQIGFLLLIVGALKNGSFICRICNFWFLRVLGAMCFSIYVWHSLLLTSSYNWNFSNFWNIGAYFIATFILGAISYRFIEFGSEKSAKKLFLLE